MEKFEFFAPAYLIKSGNPKQEIKIGGIISTEDRDIDGEILKSLDWSYFTGGWGKIKYEHSDIPEPDCFIGFPTKLIRRGGQTSFEGNLISFDPQADEKKLTPQQRLSKSTYTLLKHIEEHNEQHPDSQQKAGWSVEGDYIAKDKKTGFVKARIVNVVFTTKPRNIHTFAQLLKSLSVGYGMTPETETGFGATRKQDFANNKHKIINEVTGMKTKEELYKSCVDNGLDHKKALEEAEKLYKEQREEQKEKFGKAEKSLQSGSEKLTKSIELISGVDKVDFGIDIQDEKRSLEKSIKNSKEDDDAEAFMSKSSEIQLKQFEAIGKMGEQIKTIAKSIQTAFEGINEIFTTQETLLGGVHMADKEIASLSKGILTMNRLLAKSGGYSKDNLDNFNVDENNNNNQNVILTKSQRLEVMDELVKEGAMTDKERSVYVTTDFISPKNEALVKSKRLTLKK